MTDENLSGAPEGAEDVVDTGVDPGAEPVADLPEHPADEGDPAGAAWLESLSGDNADFAAGKGWDGPDGAIRSYRNLESLFGHDRAGRTVVLPQDEDDAAAYDALYDRLGRPDAPEGYRFEGGEESALPPDGAMLEWFRDTAYEAGLTDRQASALFDAWNGMAASRIDALQAAGRADREESEHALREKWGGAFDRRLGHARRAAHAFGGEHLDALESAMGLAPLTEVLSRIGEAIGEDALPVGEGTGRFGLSPEEARANYERRKGDADFVAALQDASHPGHAAARSERARYIDAIWPHR